MLTILLALLMCYMLFCAVMCAIAASGQGGGAYTVMLFSIIVTYGGRFFCPYACFLSTQT